MNKMDEWIYATVGTSGLTIIGVILVGKLGMVVTFGLFLLISAKTWSENKRLLAITMVLINLVTTGFMLTIFPI